MSANHGATAAHARGGDPAKDVAGCAPGETPAMIKHKLERARSHIARLLLGEPETGPVAGQLDEALAALDRALAILDARKPS